MVVLELFVELIFDLFFDYAMSPKAPKFLRVITFVLASLILVPLLFFFVVMMIKIPGTNQPLVDVIVMMAILLFVVSLIGYLYAKLLMRFIATNRL